MHREKNISPRYRPATFVRAMCGVVVTISAVSTLTGTSWAQQKTGSDYGTPSGSPSDIIAAAQRKAAMPAAKSLGKGAASGKTTASASPITLKTSSATISPNLSASTSAATLPITNATNNWVAMGPFNLQVGASGHLGPAGSYISGRVNGVAFDTWNPDLVYVASDGGGLWALQRTANTWLPMGQDSFPILRTSSVAVNPLDNRIVFVGTKGAGIMRSLNANLGASQGYRPNPNATWINVGTNIGTVGSIVVSPINPSIILATSDPVSPAAISATQDRSQDSVTKSRLFRSTDNGNTWADVTPTLTQSDLLSTEAPPDQSAQPPAQPLHFVAEGFQDVKFGLDGTGWATGRRAGLYRSDDNGATWVHVPAPLVYNPITVRGQKTGRFIPEYDDRYAGGYACHVATSKNPNEPYTVYVMDTNVQFSDGKIWKSKDLGSTWTEVTGNLPAKEGPNNTWTVANRGSFLESVPVDIGNGPQDLLYGGLLTLVDALDGGPLWLDVTRTDGAGPLTHDIERSLAYFFNPYFNNAINPSYGGDLVFDSSTYVVANDGGVTGFTTGAETIFSAKPFNRTVNADISSKPSSQWFSISELNGAAFHPTDHTQFLAGLDNNLFALCTGVNPMVLNGVTYNMPIWAGGKFLESQIPESPISTPTPPSPLPPTNAPPAYVFAPSSSSTGDDSGGAVAYDGGNPQIQYAMTAGTGQSWPNRRIYMTANAWNSANPMVEDITPDRYLITNPASSPPYTAALNSNGASPTYLYPTIAPQDTSIESNWKGETKSYSGILYVSDATITKDNINERPLYTGGNYLWRFDANTTGVAASFLSTPNVFIKPSVVDASNHDYGRWRRVGSTQLATDDVGQSDYITAIATLTTGTGLNQQQRVYVGTHLGRLWMMRDANQRDSPTSPTVPQFTSPWISLNNPTLPSLLDLPVPNGNPINIRREITSISVNPDHVSSDIIVAIGADNGPSKTGGAGVYRCANTLGSNFLFQSINGTVTGLPTSLVNSVTRDPNDATNTFFVGTDIGIFTTTDQGSNWSDAGQALGLPSTVSIRSTEVTTDSATGVTYLNAATIGRGIWQVQLSSTTPAAAPAISGTATFSRSYGSPTGSGAPSSNINVALKITNTGGSASNFKILSATLVSTNASSQSVLTPTTIGGVTNAGPGSKTFNLTYPGTVGIAGSSVTLTVTYSYDYVDPTTGKIISVPPVTTPPTAPPSFPIRSRLP